jgi:hypothetical protein
MADDPWRERHAHINLSERDQRLYYASLARETEQSEPLQKSLFGASWLEADGKSGPDTLQSKKPQEIGEIEVRNASSTSNDRAEEQVQAEVVREGKPLVEAQKERELSWTEKLDAEESRVLNSRDSLMFASAGQKSNSWSSYIDSSRDPMATAEALGLRPQMDRMEQNHREAIGIDRGEGRER